MPNCYQLLILAAFAICQSEAGVLRAAYARWKSRADGLKSPNQWDGPQDLAEPDPSLVLGWKGSMPIVMLSEGSATDHLDDENFMLRSEYRNPWDVVSHSSRHKWNSNHQHRGGVYAFFRSAVFYEWCIFLLALPMFVMLHYHLVDWPSTKWFHSVALLVWLGVAQVYLFVVWYRLGANVGMQWLTGYVLEFIFSIENVFVFHIVVKAFKTPRRFTQKLLFIVICCQIAFEAVFYMGLADMLRRMLILPYILGIWLIYVGIEAARDDHSAELAVKETSVYRSFERIFGSRLRAEYDDDGDLFGVDHAKNGQWYVTLLGPVLASLLIVDFLLEVDVTLTKIEELQNHYIAFTSSVVAAFAVPELFFVARDLFQRYYLLKFGISFVLVFFGLQMLFQSVVNIPDLLSCAIIIAVMLLCMALSSYFGWGPGNEDGKADGGISPRPAGTAEAMFMADERGDRRLPAPPPTGEGSR